MEFAACSIAALRDVTLQGCHDSEDGIALVTGAGSEAEVVHHRRQGEQGISAQLFVVNQRLKKKEKKINVIIKTNVINEYLTFE